MKEYKNLKDFVIKNKNEAVLEFNDGKRAVIDKCEKDFVVLFENDMYGFLHQLDDNLSAGRLWVSCIYKWKIEAKESKWTIFYRFLDCSPLDFEVAWEREINGTTPPSKDEYDKI